MEHVEYLISIVENLIEGIETQDIVLSAAVVVFLLQYLWLFCVWVSINSNDKQVDKDVYVKE